MADTDYVGLGFVGRQTPMTRLLKKRVVPVSVAVLVALATLSVQTTTSRAQSETETPRKRVLVVSANVNEFRKNDVEHPLDMKRFVTRLLRKTPQNPDVVLLQEVNREAVRRIRRLLSRGTGVWWSVAVGAPRAAFRRTGPRQMTGTDTAILINSRTTRALRPGGFIQTGYSVKDARAGQKVKRKRHAYTLLRREGSGFNLGVVSIHYPQPNVFRNRRTSNRLKAKWNRKVNRAIRTSYPNAGKTRRLVVAGDFNSRRCKGRFEYVCPFTAPYSVMEAKGYEESIYEMERGWSFIDFVFTTASTSDANFDEKRFFTPWYSDHRFRWALLELKDQTPPTRVYTWTREYPDYVHVHAGPKSLDGGSGVKHYRFERSTTSKSGPFEVVGTATVRNFDDYTAEDHMTYWYRVRVEDRAGNVSGFKDVSRIDT